MSAPILRWLFAVTLCTALLALTLPARAAQRQAHETMSCCAKPAEQQMENHCGNQAPPADDDHCCAACAIGLSLFLTASPHFVFSRPRGEQLAVGQIAQATRFDRPPVPPPRASVA